MLALSGCIAARLAGARLKLHESAEVGSTACCLAHFVCPDIHTGGASAR
ncbi:MAG: hypothetical protein ACFLMY_18215 [Candidatus Brachytrichaceae bacterium NZ_4S206]